MKIKSILLTLASIFCLTSCEIIDPIPPAPVRQAEVTVKITCDEYCYVVGEPIVAVEKDGSLSFHINFEEGYAFAMASSGKFVDGILTLENISYSQTVNVYSRLLSKVSIIVNNDPTLGDIQISPNKTSFAVGEIVTVTSTPKTDRDFSCWSLNEYYHVSVDQMAGSPISFTSSYTFVVTDSVILWANYLLETKESWIINYDANGGETIDGEPNFIIDTIEQFGFINPITVNGSWYLKREGYTLSSYNTRPDGSGVRVGIGSKASRSLFDSENKLTLYAQWEKWSDLSIFAYSEDNSGVIIDKYIGNATKVVIPNIISNQKVTRIKEGAFTDCMNLELVIFNEDLQIIDEFAFNNCPNLNTIQIYSSLVKAHSNSFNHCDLLETCYINANSLPLTKDIATTDLTKQVDYMDTWETQLPRMIFCSISTGRANNRLDFATKTNAKYRTFIFAGGGRIDMNLIYNILLKQVSVNDKIVFVAHKYKLGPVIGERNISYVNNNFDLIAELDFRLIKAQILESFEAYASVTTNDYREPYYSLQRLLGFNEYNYSVTPEVNPSPENKSSSRLDYTNFVNNFEEYIGYIRLSTEAAGFPKENVVITTRPFNINNIENFDSFRLLDEKYREYFAGFTFIDHIQDNFYPGDYFLLNDDMHLNPMGGYERLKRWDSLLSQI